MNNKKILPLFVRKSDGLMFDGYHRLKAAKYLGFKKMLVYEFDLWVAINGNSDNIINNNNDDITFDDVNYALNNYGLKKW